MWEHGIIKWLRVNSTLRYWWSNPILFPLGVVLESYALKKWWTYIRASGVFSFKKLTIKIPHYWMFLFPVNFRFCLSLYNINWEFVRKILKPFSSSLTTTSHSKLSRLTDGFMKWACFPNCFLIRISNFRQTFWEKYLRCFLSKSKKKKFLLFFLVLMPKWVRNLKKKDLQVSLSFLKYEYLKRFRERENLSRILPHNSSGQITCTYKCTALFNSVYEVDMAGAVLKFTDFHMPAISR